MARALYADWDKTLERLSAGGAKVVLILPLFAEKTDPNECGGQEGLETPECVDPILSNGALRTIYFEWAATHPDDLVVIDEAARCVPRPRARRSLTASTCGATTSTSRPVAARC